MPISILIFLLIIILILIICSIIINSLPFNNNILGGTKGFNSNKEFTRMLEFLKKDDELYNSNFLSWIGTEDYVPDMRKRIGNFATDWLKEYYGLFGVGHQKGQNNINNNKLFEELGIVRKGNNVTNNGLCNKIMNYISLRNKGKMSEASIIETNINSIFSKYRQTNTKNNTDEVVYKSIQTSYNTEKEKSKRKELIAKREELIAEKKEEEFLNYTKNQEDKTKESVSQNKQLDDQLQAEKDYDSSKRMFGFNWGDSLDIDDPKDKSNREKLKLRLKNAKDAYNNVNSSDNNVNSSDNSVNSSDNDSVNSSDSLEDAQNIRRGHRQQKLDTWKKKYPRVQSIKDINNAIHAKKFNILSNKDDINQKIYNI